MNQRKRNLKGSPARDLFKQLHKTMMRKTHYAFDMDFVLVEKRPVPFIVALLDVKCLGDNITFTEALGYNLLSNQNDIPVFIVEAQHYPSEFSTVDPLEHVFNVSRFVQADWRPEPPDVHLELVAENLTWDGLCKWEQALRLQRKKEILPMEQWR